MTVALPPLAMGMNSSADPGVLHTIGMTGVSLALWDRRLPQDLSAALDGLPPEQLPRMRRRLAVRDVPGAVRAACVEAGAMDCADGLAIVAADLARHAADVLAAPLLELRLQVTNGQPCPKWHLDAVAGRLLCTLRGPGTEFGPIGPAGEPQAVHQMARGAVGVFRGVLWPGPELAAILHRSPPAEAGDARLLLVIDAVDDAGDC